eukprot:3394221-Amphidinium_carterae.1
MSPVATTPLLCRAACISAEVEAILPRGSPKPQWAPLHMNSPLVVIRKQEPPMDSGMTPWMAP